jgi:thioester reductase-like protein
MKETVFVTGATGLIGRGVVQQLLEIDPQIDVYILVRDLDRWARETIHFGLAGNRITAVKGDITEPGLGLDAFTRSRMRHEVTAIVHAAADTTFSRSLDESRRTNTIGTASMVEFALDCPELLRFAYVSTAYVAGKRTGLVLERDNGVDAGWVNAYEQSKYEAECLVRSSHPSWTIFRPSTVVCQGLDGRVTQINAVHRALRIYHRGLAAMMPGGRDDSIDLITADYVNEAIARLTLDARATGRTIHLCSGRFAGTLGELLDEAYEVWERDSAWKKRRFARPMFTDLETYNMFERAVMETGNARLRDLISSLSYFVPQLAHPKIFDTASADELLETTPPRTSAYWRPMLMHLIASDWGVTRARERAA